MFFLKKKNIIVLVNANVAQLVEQFTRNEQVAGSNPAISSKKRHSVVSAFFWSYVFCERESKIYIMHPTGVYIMPPLCGGTTKIKIHVRKT